MASKKPQRQRRLERELSNISEDPPEKCSAQPTDGNLSNWIANIKGPDDSPYRNGIFKLNVSFPEDYPNRPPTVEFATKVYHPNIDPQNGFIGLSILHEDWCPALTISPILISIQAFLSSPDPTNPVSPEIAEQYVMRREEFDHVAERWTREYARPDLNGQD